MLSLTPPVVAAENSTIVRIDLTPWQFKLRALALQLPLPGRAQRAADLFCTPLPGTRARARRATAPDFARRTVEHQGLRYQAFVLGNPLQQPYLLCSHGWSSFGLRFAPWAMAARAAGFALVSFDHAAHGDSDGSRASFPSFVAGVNAIRAEFGEPAAAIGHSFGAAALAMAAAENGLHAPLVLIAPPANLMVAIGYFAKRLGYSQRGAEQIADALSTQVGRSVRDYNVRHFAPRLRQRLLVVHDIGDCDVSWEAGAAYALLAPHARLLSTDGLGHHRVLTAPQTLQAAFAHIAGGAVGERLLGNDLDEQLILR